MFNIIPGVTFDSAFRYKNKQNSKFIQTVAEEDRRAKEIENLIRQRTAENPYSKALMSTLDISDELKEQRRKSFLEEKRRQQLRTNNEELQLLERNLRRAYASKSLAEQIAQREALRKEECEQNQEENEKIAEARNQQKVLEIQQEKEERLKKDRFRQDLLAQIAAEKEKKLQICQESIEDKQAVDNLIRKVSNEEMQEMQYALDRKIKLRTEMEEFKRQQEEWRQLQKLNDNGEDERNKEILRQKDIDKKQREETQKQLRVYKEQISERIGNDLRALENTKRDRANFLVDLLVEEFQAKEHQKLKRDVEQNIRDRIKYRLELDQHKEDVERLKIERQKEEDRMFYEDQMRILAERDKLEQMSNEKRRRKTLEHRRFILDALKDKKNLKAEELIKVVHDREMDDIEEKQMKKMIEEERANILKGHPSSLIGYFPHGALKDSDFEQLPIPTKK